MNKRLISRLMRERVSGLHNAGVYFFGGDFEHILTGIVLEYVPRGVYLYDFRFPLFDFAGPNLTYSDRLQNDRLQGGAFIGKGEMSEEAIVDVVMNSPEARNVFEAEAAMTLSEFAEYLLKSNKGIRSPHARLIYAATLILLGQESLAADMLDKLPPTLHPSDAPHCQLLGESLRQSFEAAQALLEQVRQKNLRAFGLIKA